MRTKRVRKPKVNLHWGQRAKTRQARVIRNHYINKFLQFNLSEVVR